MWREHDEVIERPRIGLALSGGAARGIAHVGVLQVLAESGIPVDCVAGTSAGALVGGAFAAGMPLEEIEKIGRSLRWRLIGSMTLVRGGVQSNARLEEFMRKFLPVTRFEDLPTPFAAVATDLHTGEPVVMKEHGDVPFAIRASCTIPGWYVPVTDERGRTLIDGGLVANVPTVSARSLGADIVIAVDVNSEGAKFMGPPQSVVGIIIQAMMLVQRSASALQLREADVVISPPVGHIRWDELSRADELIRAGREAAQQSLEKICALLEAEHESSSKLIKM